MSKTGHTPTQPLHAWGDLGNGYYQNPILNADYSDPDVIRVGDSFYMVCSDFHFMGIPVLHSRDLVNWKIVGRVYDRFLAHPRYDEMDGYAKGSWAPAIRYHDGWFFVYFCTPDEGLYMSRTQNPEGPWEPLHEVRRVVGWEDPCPFWDEDGNAYLGHSTVGAGPIIIHKMSADGKTLLDEGQIVYVGKIAEGTKIFKRNGYYYLSIPEGGVEVGWQTVLRSKSIYGPYEKKIVLVTGSTIVNGPHQGAVVELENGESWFIHFQSAGALGRVCHLQPVRWVEDWPIMGTEDEPVSLYKKPNTGVVQEPFLPQASDDFNDSSLGLQWQWNHNPVDGKWSLTDRPGYLSLYALNAPHLLKAKNTLTQKLMGKSGAYTVTLNTEAMADGQRAGLGFLGGREENWLALVKENGLVRVEATAGGIRSHGPLVEGSELWLKAVYHIDGESYFYFSFDGAHFFKLGEKITLKAGFWKGARPGLFSFNTQTEGGRADFTRFVFEAL